MTALPHQPVKSIRYLWILLFLLAAAIWIVQIGRPVDLPNWHEFDYSSIARNFVREGNNILYPRIDWRGDGPGYTEMEFPIIPWSMGQLYRVFGTHEIIGRIFSYVFTLLSLLVFSRIALKVLPEPAAFIASLFFVVAHVIALVATAIQPEALMLLLYLLAVYYFIDWYDRRSWLSYALAIASFALSMLVKSPAAHLAIFFFLWALHKDGMKAFRRPSLYFFAALSFAPVVVWYAHAASLWHQFHNSMGVSNEDHWFGLDILSRPKVMANLFSIDVLLVAGGGGAIVAFVAIITGRLRSEVNRLTLYWCLAVAVYLLVIIRTSGAYWASYYHVVAVPPLALLFAAGVSSVPDAAIATWQRIARWSAIVAVLLIVPLTLLSKRDPAHLPGVFQDLVNAHSSIAVLLVLAVLSFGVTVLSFRLAVSSQAAPRNTPFPTWSRTAIILIVGCFSYFFLSGQMLLGTWRTFGSRTPLSSSAQCIKPKLMPGSLIVASGGICLDPGGHRVANDAPDMFYWLNHKGFTTCEGHESVAELQAFALRGARYYVADKDSLQDRPEFAAALRKAFPLLADCNAALLFSLRPR